MTKRSTKHRAAAAAPPRLAGTLAEGERFVPVFNETPPGPPAVPLTVRPKSGPNPDALSQLAAVAHGIPLERIPKLRAHADEDLSANDTTIDRTTDPHPPEE